ncbi:galactose-1-epimerase, partial [Hymenobacter edaphi]
MNHTLRASLLTSGAVGLAGLLSLSGCDRSSPTTTDAEQSAADRPAQAADSAAAPTAAAFGRTADGQQAELYTLRNAHGVQVSITNYGGTITRLFVPDKAG